MYNNASTGKEEVDEVTHTTANAHPSIVVRCPNLSRLAWIANGRPTPVALLPAHMMPYASPLRRANSSSRHSVDVAKRSPVPSAASTPCSAISCPMWTTKADAKKEALVITSPMGPNQWRREG